MMYVFIHTNMFTVSASESTHSFSDAGGETQVSSFHIRVSQETVCVDRAPQCSQSVKRRLLEAVRVHLLHQCVICIQ